MYLRFKRSRSLFSFLLLCALVSCLFSSSPVYGKGKNGTAPVWRRADFEVKGVGCVLCIRRLTYVLRHSAGVREATVELRKPHKSVLVYDSRKTSLQKVFSQFNQEAILKPVKVEHLKDAPLAGTAAGSKE